MITLTLTEAEAARISYAIEAEAQRYHLIARNEIENGALSVSSGRAQLLAEEARNELLGVVRRIEEAMQ